MVRWTSNISKKHQRVIGRDLINALRRIMESKIKKIHQGSEAASNHIACNVLMVVVQVWSSRYV